MNTWSERARALGIKPQWETVAYLPNHGQHYTNTFSRKWEAVQYANIQRANPLFEQVIVHKVYHPK